MRKEKELIYQQQLRQDLLDRKMDRREFISKTLTAGLGLAGVGVISNFGNFAHAQSRPLTPTFYQWIEDLHRAFPKSIRASTMSTTRLPR
ncbi:MAG: hypothetical protein ACO20P_09820, partial [bacterium]